LFSVWVTREVEKLVLCHHSIDATRQPAAAAAAAGTAATAAAAGTAYPHWKAQTPIVLFMLSRVNDPRSRLAALRRVITNSRVMTATDVFRKFIMWERLRYTPIDDNVEQDLASLKQIEARVSAYRTYSASAMRSTFRQHRLLRFDLAEPNMDEIIAILATASIEPCDDKPVSRKYKAKHKGATGRKKRRRESSDTESDDDVAESIDGSYNDRTCATTGDDDDDDDDHTSQSHRSRSVRKKHKISSQTEQTGPVTPAQPTPFTARSVPHGHAASDADAATAGPGTASVPFLRAAPLPVRNIQQSVTMGASPTDHQPEQQQQHQQHQQQQQQPQQQRVIAPCIVRLLGAVRQYRKAIGTPAAADCKIHAIRALDEVATKFGYQPYDVTLEFWRERTISQFVDMLLWKHTELAVIEAPSSQAVQSSDGHDTFNGIVRAPTRSSFRENGTSVLLSRARATDDANAASVAAAAIAVAVITSSTVATFSMAVLMWCFVRGVTLPTR